MFSELKPKNCTYGCGVEIYWNTEENAYFELHSRKKHIYPNRGTYNKKSTIMPPTYATKPKYYNNNYKKSNSSSNNKQQSTITNKPKMDNSFKKLSGSSISIIKKQYEILSDIVRDHNGKIQGSQSHIITNNNLYLIVYYEVQEGQRDEIKRKFAN